LRVLPRFNKLASASRFLGQTEQSSVCTTCYSLLRRLNTASRNGTETLPFSLLRHGPRGFRSTFFPPVYSSRLNERQQIYNKRKHGITARKKRGRERGISAKYPWIRALNRNVHNNGGTVNIDNLHELWENYEDVQLDKYISRHIRYISLC